MDKLHAENIADNLHTRSHSTPCDSIDVYVCVLKICNEHQQLSKLRRKGESTDSRVLSTDHHLQYCTLMEVEGTRYMCYFQGIIIDNLQLYLCTVSGVRGRGRGGEGDVGCTLPLGWVSTGVSGTQTVLPSTWRPQTFFLSHGGPAILPFTWMPRHSSFHIEAPPFFLSHGGPAILPFP